MSDMMDKSSFALDFCVGALLMAWVWLMFLLGRIRALCQDILRTCDYIRRTVRGGHRDE